MIKSIASIAVLSLIAAPAIADGISHDAVVILRIGEDAPMGKRIRLDDDSKPVVYRASETVVCAVAYKSTVRGAEYRMLCVDDKGHTVHKGVSPCDRQQATGFELTVGGRKALTGVMCIPDEST